MFVIGTAGHVDHGKSTLVQALTGINPDRLREEQEREMTIDLGFAWLTLPSGREVSVVDVPGHEDFIKNMLAGIGAIDVALLVVAADEAVMPQTREHLAIVDLLEVPLGVVALTKSDLVADPEWLELVREEVREELVGTVLEDAEIVPVSALTGVGLPELCAELDRQLDKAEPRKDMGSPRLPIDRVFTISGFGTVVTGTLSDGHLAIGEEVAIVPGDRVARIRGLQSHKTKVQEAEPGSRVAINLTGVGVEDLSRGQVVAHRGRLEATSLVDARLRLLDSVPWPLKHSAEVSFYSGAARVSARVRLLDSEQLEPGQTGWVQFRLQEPIVLVRGDHYVIRLASPSLTLGGGKVVQPLPARRHRRFNPQVMARLDVLEKGFPDQVLLHILSGPSILDTQELARRAGLPDAEAAAALEGLMDEGRVLALAEVIGRGTSMLSPSLPVISSEGWNQMLAEMAQALSGYHERYPLRVGMAREELKSRLGIDPKYFAEILGRAAAEGHIAVRSTTVAHSQHTVTLSAEQHQAVSGAMAAFSSSPFRPPTVSDVEKLLGPELLQVLLDEGRLMKVSENVAFDADTYVEMKRRLEDYMTRNGSITVAQVRDLFDTSRRYALGFLEHMDRVRVTKRLGDLRVLR